jgi:ribonucleotide reductase beta subunit family protein with ferritin-like domain
MNIQETLLNEENNRLTVYPIKYDNIWQSYKTQMASFWTAEEIDFSNDYSDFQKLSNNEKHFIKMVLAFFAASDAIVNINLGDRFTKEVQIREAIITYNYQMMIENIHCVSGDTLILTDTGYHEIEKQLNTYVNVWNGVAFSKVLIQYTGDSELCNVTLSNGMQLKCTPNHKWFINNDNNKKIIFTKDLKIGDIIYNYELPTIDFESNELTDPYERGFNSTYNINSDVPINYSVKTKIIWFEGLCESNLNNISNINIIIIKHPNFIFLQQVQLMLTTLGVNSYINQNQDCLTVRSINKLFNLGFHSKILKPNDIVNSKTIYIVGIEKLSGIHKTYCFNEPNEHAGIFNGILTGQSEVYSLMIDNIVRDVDEKCRLFNAIKEYPCVAKKALWAQKWIESSAPFSQRLIAFAIVEGIFFSGSFCAIFWLKKKNLMPGLCDSNELIARDEGMHCDYAILLYSMIKNRLTQDVIHTMFKEAIEIEREFICDSLPCSLLGMNSELMVKYIQFVADRLLMQLKYDKIWGVVNPFDFMESISMEGKTNFFESRPTQYQKASVLNTSRDTSFIASEDF